MAGFQIMITERSLRHLLSTKAALAHLQIVLSRPVRFEAGHSLELFLAQIARKLPKVDQTILTKILCPIKKRISTGS